MPVALILALDLSQAPAEPFAGKVVGISDGDTLTVLVDRQTVKVRLHGVDAPESGQPFGSTAKKLASKLAFKQAVTVRPHDVDRYGRTVAEVTLPDGRDLGRELVGSGLAPSLISSTVLNLLKVDGLPRRRHRPYDVCCVSGSVVRTIFAQGRILA